MLEYSKNILNKVSFDEELLEKELGKALRNTSPDEGPALLEWCRKELGEKCGEIASRRSQLLNGRKEDTLFNSKN